MSGEKSSFLHNGEGIQNRFYTLTEALRCADAWIAPKTTETSTTEQTYAVNYLNAARQGAPVPSAVNAEQHGSANYYPVQTNQFRPEVSSTTEVPVTMPQNTLEEAQRLQELRNEVNSLHDEAGN